jgi:hypothetical protein
VQVLLKHSGVAMTSNSIIRLTSSAGQFRWPAVAGESGVTDGAMEDFRVYSLMKSFMVEFKVSLNASFFTTGLPGQLRSRFAISVFVVH